ncbi:SixA phosphatase family protein [Planosporangium mesophilum]|uniref:SixA phosphatase family protein n=1 Tax=Planosporangium mesophilum TaxID=689768 RepID=UPI00143C11B5|nr:histidine phosphatase family protein [Planosporangium mesophilum]NJC82139.1 histidine phosphatase family protein [Planosporangium mesophilum]
MTDRTLVLLRHAKAANPGDVADAQRALTTRGQADAAAAGTWLADNQLLPDLVLSSPARRARETWHGVAPALGDQATHTTVVYEPTIYNAATGQELLDLVGTTDPDVTTLLVIGHNPPLSALSSLLDPGADEDLRTSGVAVHRVPDVWGALAAGGAPRMASHTARA